MYLRIDHSYSSFHFNWARITLNRHHLFRRCEGEENMAFDIDRNESAVTRTIGSTASAKLMEKPPLRRAPEMAHNGRIWFHFYPIHNSSKTLHTLEHWKILSSSFNQMNALKFLKVLATFIFSVSSKELWKFESESAPLDLSVFSHDSPYR